jgi:hypothetical protein
MARPIRCGWPINSSITGPRRPGVTAIARQCQRTIPYGSLQGCSPEEPGPHGCTLVHVAGDRAIRTQFTPTDCVRWHTERLAIEEDATLDGVRRQLTDRVKQLKAEVESRPLIVTWKLRGGAHLAGPAGRRDLAAEWQEWLRKEFFLAGSKPVLWTSSVELDQPNLPDAWFDEESMLGDFLRNLQELAALDPAAVEMGQHIPNSIACRLAALSRGRKRSIAKCYMKPPSRGAASGCGERDS